MESVTEIDNGIENEDEIEEAISSSKTLENDIFDSIQDLVTQNTFLIEYVTSNDNINPETKNEDECLEDFVLNSVIMKLRDFYTTLSSENIKLSSSSMNDMRNGLIVLEKRIQLLNHVHYQKYSDLETVMRSEIFNWKEELIKRETEHLQNYELLCQYTESFLQKITQMQEKSQESQVHECCWSVECTQKENKIQVLEKTLKEKQEILNFTRFLLTNEIEKYNKLKKDFLKYLKEFKTKHNMACLKEKLLYFKLLREEKRRLWTEEFYQIFK